MMNEQLLRSMRSMAWERAKGELMSMLWTYHTENNFDYPGKYDKFEETILKFFDEIEGQGLQE